MLTFSTQLGFFLIGLAFFTVFLLLKKAGYPEKYLIIYSIFMILFFPFSFLFFALNTWPIEKEVEIARKRLKYQDEDRKKMEQIKILLRKYEQQAEKDRAKIKNFIENQNPPNN